MRATTQPIRAAYHVRGEEGARCPYDSTLNGARRAHPPGTPTSTTCAVSKFMRIVRRSTARQRRTRDPDLPRARRPGAGPHGVSGPGRWHTVIVAVRVRPGVRPIAGRSWDHIANVRVRPRVRLNVDGVGGYRGQMTILGA